MLNTMVATVRAGAGPPPPCMVGLAEDLIPLVNLESLGVDKDALASELLSELKKAPSLGEVLAAIKQLFP